MKIEKNHQTIGNQKIYGIVLTAARQEDDEASDSKLICAALTRRLAYGKLISNYWGFSSSIHVDFRFNKFRRYSLTLILLRRSDCVKVSFVLYTVRIVLIIVSILFLHINYEIMSVRFWLVKIHLFNFNKWRSFEEKKEQ